MSETKIIKYNNKNKPVADIAIQTDAIKCKGNMIILKFRISNKYRYFVE